MSGIAGVTHDLEDSSPTHDGSGRQTQRSDAGETVTSEYTSYNAIKHATAGAKDITYLYDGFGNLVRTITTESSVPTQTQIFIGSGGRFQHTTHLLAKAEHSTGLSMVWDALVFAATKTMALTAKSITAISVNASMR